MSSGLIDRIPDGLYWKMRHTAIFLMNLPLQPVWFAWLWAMSIYYNIIDCFTCDGSSQIDPFWKWGWGGAEND